MKKIIFVLISFFLLASCSNSQDAQKPTESTSGTVNAVSSETEKLNPNPPTYGSGKHTLQIFADFQCPACQQSDALLSPIFEEYASQGKLTIQYRQYPLPFHQNALGDALAAMCANDQGKFREYKKEMYALEIAKNGAVVSNDDRVGLAEKLGLNKDDFATCLNDKKYADYIENDKKLGGFYGLRGTPTYILDGKTLSMSNFPGNTEAEVHDNVRKFLDKLNAE